MTDISDLREGDEIEVVMRMRCGVDTARNSRGGYYTFPYLFDVAERVTVVRPEIIPGQPYVRHPDGITRPHQPGCTCGAGLLKLMVGGR